MVDWTQELDPNANVRDLVDEIEARFTAVRGHNPGDTIPSGSVDYELFADDASVMRQVAPGGSAAVALWNLGGAPWASIQRAVSTTETVDSLTGANPATHLLCVLASDQTVTLPGNVSLMLVQRIDTSAAVLTLPGVIAPNGDVTGIKLLKGDQVGLVNHRIVFERRNTPFLHDSGTARDMAWWENTVVFQGSGAAANLPDPDQCGQYVYRFINNRGSGSVTISPFDAEDVAGGSSLVLTSPGDYASLVVHGGDWLRVG